MSYCDDCLHREVCGEEGAREESLTFCDDKMKSVPIEVLKELRAEIEANMWTNDKYRYEKNALASGLEKAVQIIDRKISEVSE